MRDDYMTIGQARKLNNSSPEHQLLLTGNKLRVALNGISDGKRVRYVNSSKTNSGDGNTFESGFKTITEAVQDCDDGDVVRVRGSFDEGDVVTIDKEIWIIGDNFTSNGYPTLLQNSDDHALFLVKANNVAIFNMGFVPTTAYPAIQIGDAAGQAYYKAFIHNCKFDLYNTGTYGIASGGGGATADAPDIHIDNCLFRSFATAAMLSNWTRARITNNIIRVGTAMSGIIHVPDGGNRPDTDIIGNKFITTDGSDGVGITLSNTPTVGMLFIDDNRFCSNFADADHCVTARTGYMGLNYFGITALAVT